MTRLPFPRLAGLLALVALAGCATHSKTTGNFPIKITPSSGIEITGAKTRKEPYGLVISGHILIAPHLPVSSVHSVDIAITGPEGEAIRKFTTGYFPVPRADRKKPQHAHFMMMTYSVPPEGSVIQVSLTPEPKPEEPGQPAPENR